MSIVPLRRRPPFVAVPVEVRLALSVPLMSGTAECGLAIASSEPCPVASWITAFSAS